MGGCPTGHQRRKYALIISARRRYPACRARTGDGNKTADQEADCQKSRCCHQSHEYSLQRWDVEASMRLELRHRQGGQRLVHRNPHPIVTNRNHGRQVPSNGDFVPPSYFSGSVVISHVGCISTGGSPRRRRPGPGKAAPRRPDELGRDSEPWTRRIGRWWLSRPAAPNPRGTGAPGHGDRRRARRGSRPSHRAGSVLPASRRRDRSWG
jgi:hypothetical protein